MSMDDILSAWGDADRMQEIGDWLVSTCADVRRAIEGASDPAVTKSPGVTVKDVRVEDAVENYLPYDDFADVFAANACVDKALSVLPPEDPTPGEAAFYLARHEILKLARRYARGLIMQVGFQRRLHAPGRGLGECEIKNLFCEPGEENGVSFAWVGVFAGLCRLFPQRAKHEAELAKLHALFRSLADVYYDLTMAVYRKKEPVLACRRAFSAFWRHVGLLDFMPYLQKYGSCRQSLDAAIVNGDAGKFLDLDALLCESAKSQIELRECVASVRIPSTPVAALLGGETPKSAESSKRKRGPHGRRKTIPVAYAATVYGVSRATICNWDKCEGGVPDGYCGRDVDIDTFNRNATKCLTAMGHREGVTRRIMIATRNKKPRPPAPR